MWFTLWDVNLSLHYKSYWCQPTRVVQLVRTNAERGGPSKGHIVSGSNPAIIDTFCLMKTGCGKIHRETPIIFTHKDYGCLLFNGNWVWWNTQSICILNNKKYLQKKQSVWSFEKLGDIVWGWSRSWKSESEWS